MFPYDRTFQPPAPALNVFVSRSEGMTPHSLRAIVDSGSSLTALPIHILKALKVPVYDELTISGYADEKSRVRTYIIALEVTGHCLWPLEVAGLPRDDAILGRDVLNECIINLDGPELTFDIQFP